MNILKNVFRLLSPTKFNIRINNSIENNKENFLVLFDKIEIILRKGEHYAQANIIENAKSYLLNAKYDEFQTKITSVNFWGGSGAIWEVYFANQELQKNSIVRC